MLASGGSTRQRDITDKASCLPFSRALTSVYVFTVSPFHGEFETIYQIAIYWVQGAVQGIVGTVMIIIIKMNRIKAL